MRTSLRSLALKHYGLIMVGLIILVIILMILAIREYINYATIGENIARQQDAQAYRSEKIAYEENFLIPYLESSSALFFYQHENSILGENEFLIQFERPETPEESTLPLIQERQDIREAREQFGENVWRYIRTS
jgi:Tfp pilus assembly protein PilE